MDSTPSIEDGQKSHANGDGAMDEEFDHIQQRINCVDERIIDSF